MQHTDLITERSGAFATAGFTAVGTMLENIAANAMHEQITALLADMSYLVAILIGVVQLWRMWKKRRQPEPKKISKAEARRVLFPRESHQKKEKK